MKHPKLKKKKDRSRAPFCAQRKAAESPRWSSTRDIRQSAAARGWVPCRLLPPSPFPLPGSRHQTCVEASAWNRINTDSSLTPDPVFGCTRTVAPPSGTARREIELPGLEACLLRVGHRHTASNTLHQLVVQVVQRNLCSMCGCVLRIPIVFALDKVHGFQQAIPHEDCVQQLSWQGLRKRDEQPGPWGVVVVMTSALRSGLPGSCGP
mmetsp:Transcript_64534/g.106874  ORF Transcript_64534/g.106874 Transcript_64534/m.106874 type:complete len:208 (-) Transcript_64534:864-1487(-)